MTKSVKVTVSVASANSASAHWADSRTGPYHSEVLAPGSSNTYPIASGTTLRVEQAGGPADVTLEDVGTTGVSIIQTVYSTLNPSDTASFSIAGINDQVAAS